MTERIVCSTMALFLHAARSVVASVMVDDMDGASSLHSAVASRAAHMASFHALRQRLQRTRWVKVGLLDPLSQFNAGTLNQFTDITNISYSLVAIYSSALSIHMTFFRWSLFSNKLLRRQHAQFFF